MILQFDNYLGFILVVEIGESIFQKIAHLLPPLEGSLGVSRLKRELVVHLSKSLREIGMTVHLNQSILDWTLECQGD